MEVRLVVERGGRRRVMKVGPPQAIIGRARGCAVRIPSPEVSRQHCRLLFADGILEVEDLDSVNGTFINSERVAGRAVVRPGDRLEVGPVHFGVEYELTPEALETLAARDRKPSKAGKKGGTKKEAGPMDFLDDLSDGSVLEEFEILEEGPTRHGADDLPMLEIVDEPTVSTPEDLELIKPDVSMDQAWQLPEGTEFRNLLDQMSDD